MPFLTTRNGPPAAFTTALYDGIAPDGGLYVPETIEPWTDSELERLPRRTLTEIGLRAMRPFARGAIDPATLEAVVVEALNFPIPLVEIEPGIHALELFHGPTLAFKDVGARTMARLMAALHRGGDPLTILVATSGDTGSAVGHAFYRVPNTRVVILYPDGRVSPTQEAQLTMFNGERGNVRAYAVAGSFGDCHRLTREAFADSELRRRMRLTSANSMNIGRLLPQSIYYFHAVGQASQAGQAAQAGPVGQAGPADGAGRAGPAGRAGRAIKSSGVVDAEREFRKPHGRIAGEARRVARIALRGRHQRQRHRAGVSGVGKIRTAGVDFNDRQRDGRGSSQQLRTDAVALSRRRGRDAPRRRRLPVHRR